MTARSWVMTRAGVLARVCVVVVFAALAAACSASVSTNGSGSSASSGGGEPIRIIAGSEVKDLEPMLPAIRKATGLDLKFEYVGTLDGAERVAGDHPNADLAWFSNSHYAQLLAQQSGKVFPQQSIMRSPVVLGVRDAVAARLGWSDPGAKVTWKDIADASASGKLTFGMTNPTSSNSGFSALVGVAAAFAGSADALDQGTINQEQLKRFFTGQTMTSGSSGWLADSYLKSPNKADGIINYESVLLQLNRQLPDNRKLTLIYPRDGIITADYPMMLLDPAKKAQYTRLVAYLRKPSTQQKIQTLTQRRPSVPGVKLSGVFPKTVLVEQAFPSKLDVVNTLLTTYIDKVAPNSHTYYVLDTSGSMYGERLDSMKRAMMNLTQSGDTTQRFTRFREGETVTIITFASEVQEPKSFNVTTADENGAAQQDIRRLVDSLEADGSTFLFDAVTAAYRQAVEDRKSHPDDLYSVVVLTDGEANGDMTFDDFQSQWSDLGHDARGIATFPVLFGDAATDQMQQIADLTHGKVFDGRQGNLSDVFREIRGYQ